MMEIYLSYTVMGNRTLPEALKHWKEIDNMAFDSHVKWQRLFARESMDRWNGTSHLPTDIQIHQNQRWFDIIRSN